ncbi:MAG: response regulator transcription factor [Chloroflexi bacterium]|nr:response regulator transcription factor [Chloroflexota bacterium]
MNWANRRILILGEVAKTTQCLALDLQHHGYEVELRLVDHTGLTHLTHCSPDLVIVAGTTSHVLALEICDRIGEWSDAPIIVLTCHPSSAARVAALWHGADDVLDCHVSLAELSLRIEAILRRTISPRLPS